MLKRWDRLPKELQTEAVRPYYDSLRKKRVSLFIKRVFDIFASAIMIVLLSPIFAIVAIRIKVDDPGPVFYRQVRVTQYCKEFRIFKFRTMVMNADKIGAQVTSHNDPRITKSGNFLRKYRIDELPQLFNILLGEMTFVGTRPEVPKYVSEYSDEMKATLLLTAGVTAEASIMFKDEAELLKDVKDVDSAYIEKVLPRKMDYNLEQLKHFNLWHDCMLLFKTLKAVIE